jgi:hypothetical protein
LLSLSRLRPTFRANRTKRRNKIINFSLITSPQFHFVARSNVGREMLVTMKRRNIALICVYDAAGNVIETHEHAGDFKEW